MSVHPLLSAVLAIHSLLSSPPVSSYIADCISPAYIEVDIECIQVFLDMLTPTALHTHAWLDAFLLTCNPSGLHFELEQIGV